MDIQTIFTGIGTVGFPIVACIAMAWFFFKVNENYRNDIKEINASHKEELKAMTEAINNNNLALNNNNLVIQRLIDKMEEN